MTFEEIRAHLKALGYTIVRTDRIVECWGESRVAEYDRDYCNADATEARKVDAARCVGREVSKLATIITLPPQNGIVTYRASLIVIKGAQP